MKRKVGLYAILIGIVICGLPFVTGILVETKFKEVIEVLGEIDSLPGTIKLVDYQRGWRKSRAKTLVTIFNNRTNKQRQYVLTLEHEIRHGPFVQLKDNNYKEWHFARALIHSKLLINEEAKKILLTEIGQTELFNINSEMAIDGVVRINIDSPTLKLKEQVNTGRTAWEGLSGSWVLSSDMKQLTGKVHLPGLDFDLNNTQVLLNNVYYSTQLTKSAQGLWPGKFAATANKILFQDMQNNLKVIVDGVTTYGDMELHGTLAFLSGSLKIEKLMINNREYGPIAYSNTLKNIDENVVKSFLELNRKIKTNENSFQSSMVQFVLGQLPDLLKTRPEFTIDNLQIQTPQGEVTGKLNIALGGINITNNMSQILQSIVANASFSMPKLMLREILTYQYTKEANAINENAKNLALTAQSGQVVNPSLPKVLTEAEINQEVDSKVSVVLAKWLNQGMLLDKDQSYYTNIELNHGKLVVNGHEISMPK